jgi:hypothetical protein
MKRSPRAPAKKCLQWSSWILQRMDALNVDFEGIRLDLQNLHDHAYPRKADWLLPPPKVILLWGHLILASSDEFHLMSVTSGWVCMLLHAQLWPWCSACPLQGPFGPDCVLFAVFSAPDSPLGRFFFSSSLNSLTGMTARRYSMIQVCIRSDWSRWHEPANISILWGDSCTARLFLCVHMIPGFAWAISNKVEVSATSERQSQRKTCLCFVRSALVGDHNWVSTCYSPLVKGLPTLLFIKLPDIPVQAISGAEIFFVVLHISFQRCSWPLGYRPLVAMDLPYTENAEGSADVRSRNFFYSTLL